MPGKEALDEQVVLQQAAAAALAQGGGQVHLGARAVAGAAHREVDVATPPPAGEFASMTRSQLKRNMAAIDDALENLRDGTWTETRTRVFLDSVGMKPRTIDNLLNEIVDEVAS